MRKAPAVAKKTIAPKAKPAVEEESESEEEVPSKKGKGAREVPQKVQPAAVDAEGFEVCVKNISFRAE